MDRTHRSDRTGDETPPTIGAIVTEMSASHYAVGDDMTTRQLLTLLSLSSMGSHSVKSVTEVSHIREAAISALYSPLVAPGLVVGIPSAWNFHEGTLILSASARSVDNLIYRQGRVPAPFHGAHVTSRTFATGRTKPYVLRELWSAASIAGVSASAAHRSAATSREIVDGDRSSPTRSHGQRLAAGKPRETSSRSENDKRNGERCRSGLGWTAHLANSPYRAMRPPDLFADHTTRQPLRRQLHDPPLLQLRQSFHNTPPDRSNSIEGADALTP